MRILLIALMLCAATFAASAQSIEHACDAAAAKAEQDWNVPPGVLSAVGTVESGRQHGPLGAAPWPWTINAAGRGLYFDTKQAAIEAVLALMQRGYPYIDVGCFQIDIAYHPDLFRSLDEAFDADRNAQAAARLLATERAHAPDWATAVARYHSATPELSGPYLQRVRAALPTAMLRGRNATEWVFSDGVAVSSEASRTLPKVIYPAAAPPSHHEPQIIFMGDTARLPKVIETEIGAWRARR